MFHSMALGARGAAGKMAEIGCGRRTAGLALILAKSWRRAIALIVSMPERTQIILATQ